MPKKHRIVGPEDKDTRLHIIDLGGGIVHGVETNIPEVLAAKVPVLVDKKVSEGDRDEIVVEGTDRIVH